MRGSVSWAQRAKVGAAVIGVASLVAGGVVVGSEGVAAAASKRPIKVAFLGPFTGAAAVDGKLQKEGFELGLKEFGKKVDGHKIEVTYLDTGATPTIGLSHAKQALTTIHANVVEGPLFGNVVSAVSPYVISHGVPEDDNNTAGLAQMADYETYKMGFASDSNSYADSTEAAKWAYNTMHWHHVTTIGDNYAFGWEAIGGFDKEFTKLGGTITKAIWPPTTTVANIASYVSEIPHNTQAVFAQLIAAQAADFYKDMASFGLKTQIPVLGITTTTDQSVLATATVTATTGPKSYGVANYCTDIPSKANQKFVNLVHSTYGIYPSFYVETGYVKAQILVRALKSIKGTVKSSASSEKKLAKAMLAVHITAPRGPVSITKTYYGPVQNAYICNVRKITGKARTVPIKTYKKVPSWGVLSKSTWLATFSSNSTKQPSTP